jgi:NAD(P)-dependent dehydrogenase (short-subunit alcohol dehydrogenase family)
LIVVVPIVLLFCAVDLLLSCGLDGNELFCSSPLTVIHSTWNPSSNRLGGHQVVNVSSVMHRRARIDDPEKFLREFKEGDYSQAKLANVLFTFELQRRWQGKGVQACAVDPGAVASDIWRRSLFNRKPWKWLVKVNHLALHSCPLYGVSSYHFLGRSQSCESQGLYS